MGTSTSDEAHGKTHESTGLQQDKSKIFLCLLNSKPFEPSLALGYPDPALPYPLCRGCPLGLPRSCPALPLVQGLPLSFLPSLTTKNWRQQEAYTLPVWFADLEAATELSLQVQKLLQKGTSLLLEEVMYFAPSKLLDNPLFPAQACC